jgi:hypothetical protein
MTLRAIYFHLFDSYISCPQFYFIDIAYMSKTQKNVPWKGWKRENPSARQRTIMMKRCGNKCFLGPNKSFPICKKNTCKVSKKGVYAAYVRARQYHRYKISKKAKRMLRK